LVHVSQLADRFVSDPTQVVKVGQVVKVTVVEVNAGLKRIALSMRTLGGGEGRSGDVRKPADKPQAGKPQAGKPQGKPQVGKPQTTPEPTSSEPATLADLQARFGKKR
jgi:protein Tex